MGVINFTLLQSIYKTNIIVSRSLRNAMKDPRIRHRAKLINEIKDVENIDLDEMEADFHNIGQSHKHHEREIEAIREKEKFYIVRQKYFKEKLPNYLTWADKQQIKYLYATYPEEWTIEKLSEGFPALPDTIYKILKNKWIPKNANRVKRHNDAVQQNWNEYKNGKAINLPPNLIEHLSKFTSRDLNLHTNNEYQVEDISTRKLIKEDGEFSQIIQSYKAMKSKESDAVSPKIINNNNKSAVKEQHCDNVIKMSKVHLKQHNKGKQELISYEQLQRNLGDDSIYNNKSYDVADNIVGEITLKPKEILNISKFESLKSDVKLYKAQKDYSNLSYPERITIPADKRKKGYTYKLNDCYYDYDGTFLYRVPGMT